MSDIKVYEEMLLSTINEGNVEKTYLLVQELKEMVRTDPEAVKWLVEPSTLKRIHDALTENLNVPLKTMLIKNRVPHRQRRAILFVEGISNGIKRVMQ